MLRCHSERVVIASLMMYERPELNDAHERLWSLVHRQLDHRGIASPDQLDQNAEEFSVWTNPDLVLSQTCGMPYRTCLHGKVQLVGTPDYDLEGCQPGYYRSALVVRYDEPKTRLVEFAQSIFAFNKPYSQSGYAAAYWHADAEKFWFRKKYYTGAHRQSALAVADGRADIAALDAVTWRFIQQYGDIAGQLRVLDWTVPTPGLPLITSLNHNRLLIRDAVSAALDKLSISDRSLLGIKGLVPIESEDYMAVANPELEECRFQPNGETDIHST